MKLSLHFMGFVAMSLMISSLFACGPEGDDTRGESIDNYSAIKNETDNSMAKFVEVIAEYDGNVKDVKKFKPIPVSRCYSAIGEHEFSYPAEENKSELRSRSLSLNIHKSTL